MQLQQKLAIPKREKEKAEAEAAKANSSNGVMLQERAENKEYKDKLEQFEELFIRSDGKKGGLDLVAMDNLLARPGQNLPQPFPTSLPKRSSCILNGSKRLSYTLSSTEDIRARHEQSDLPSLLCGARARG